MRRYCWSVVLAGMFSLGLFGCALSGDPILDDGADSAESAEPAEPAEPETSPASQPDGVCLRWFCNSVHPSGCEGFGFGASKPRCVVEALNNCTANCGPGCVPDEDPDCDLVY